MERPGDRIARRRREIPEYRRDQEALADEVGVSRQQVSRWEGGTAMPTGENLAALARVLGVTAEWILYGDRDEQFGPDDVEALAEGHRKSLREGRGRVAEPPATYEGGPSPAQQMLDFLSQRAGARRVAGELTNKDLIAAAYTLARKHGFTAEDYRRLDAWRDQIIQSEKG